MGRLIGYCFTVKWNDDRTEFFRYDSEDEAVSAREYQNVENWSSNKLVGEPSKCVPLLVQKCRHSL